MVEYDALRQIKLPNIICSNTMSNKMQYTR